MKSIGKIIGICACLASGGAFAAFVENQSTGLDLAGLKAKCVELSGNQQLKPFNAVITCSSKTAFWRLVPSGKNMFTMKNYMEYVVSAKMKSYSMPAQTISSPIADTSAPCVILEKWTRTVPAITVELSCDKLMSIQSFVDVCKPTLDRNLADNPSLAIDEKADEVFNSCDHSMGMNTK